MSVWTPQRGEIVEPPEPRKPRLIRDGVLNPIPDGSRVRATMGENVIVGVVQWAESTAKYASVCLIPDGQRNGQDRHLTLPLASGWSFEVVVTLPMDASTGGTE
jgi:hypothetical protein